MAGRRIQHLEALVSSLEAQQRALTDVAPHARPEADVKLRFPSPFSGEKGEDCAHFLLQVDGIILFSPHTYNSDEKKSWLLYSLLNGTARTWAFGRQDLWIDYAALRAEMTVVFGQENQLWSDFVAYAECEQRSDWSVARYSSEYRVLAAKMKPEKFEVLHFMRGLRSDVRECMIQQELPCSLTEAIQLAARLESRLLDSKVRPKTPVQSQAGTAKFAHKRPRRVLEREERREKGECFNCGASDHFVALCPKRKKNEVKLNCMLPGNGQDQAM